MKNTFFIFVKSGFSFNLFVLPGTEKTQTEKGVFICGWQQGYGVPVRKETVSFWFLQVISREYLDRREWSLLCCVAFSRLGTDRSPVPDRVQEDREPAQTLAGLRH